MAKLGLSDWAKVAEIAAAAGVIISLVFVGFELRSSTAATEAATRQAMNQNDMAFLALQIDSSVLAVANTKRRAGEELTALEIDQLVREQYINFASFHYSYREYQRGALDAQAWRRHENIVRKVIQNGHYTKIMWARYREDYTPGFQALVDSFLAE